jgi:hypothetical protein
MQKHRSVIMQPAMSNDQPLDQIPHMDHIPDVYVTDSAGSHLSSIAGKFV